MHPIRGPRVGHGQGSERSLSPVRRPSLAKSHTDITARSDGGSQTLQSTSPTHRHTFLQWRREAEILCVQLLTRLRRNRRSMHCKPT